MNRPVLPSLRKLAFGIRGQVLGGIFVIALTLASIAFNDLHLAWLNFNDARRIEAVNGYVNSLIDTAKHYALERGRVSVLLRSIELPEQDDLTFIAEHRAAGNELSAVSAYGPEFRL